MTHRIDVAVHHAECQLVQGDDPHAIAREALAVLEVALKAMESQPDPLGDTTSVAVLVRYHLATVAKLVNLHEAVQGMPPPDPQQLEDYQRIRKAMGLAPLKVAEPEHRHNWVAVPGDAVAVCLGKDCDETLPVDQVSDES